MINRTLINMLHQRDIINKKHVLWWQLGFEGRRAFSDSEFKAGLKEVYNEYKLKNGELEKQKLMVWTRDEVPILIKKIKIGDLGLPCFVSIKPMSHRDGAGDGWRSLEIANEYKVPFSLYFRPHIRGLLIEKTDGFMFWHPFLFGTQPSYHHSLGIIRENEELPFLICPIHPTKFYKNLTKMNYGRKRQREAAYLDCRDINVVPYYEFDNIQNGITVYPTPIIKNRLDVPTIIKRVRGNIPEILGIGYFYFSDKNSGDAVCYWELNESQKKTAKKALIKRFGKITRS